MSAQLEQHRPGAGAHLRAAPPAPFRAAKPAPAAPPDTTWPKEPAPYPPDRDRGVPLLITFVGALAVMVADVVVIGAVEESWILIPGFAVLVLMTVIVFMVIMRLLADSGEKATRDAR